MAYRGSVSVRVLVSTFVALLAAGCENPGFSQRDAEWTRARADVGPFSVVSANHERAVVSARGRQVAIEAAEGFCLAKESIETSGRSAFAMIGDCVLDDPSSSVALPRGVPGIITVSISGDRGYTRDGEGAGSLSDLSGFLDTEEGLSLLGRGGPGGSVKVRDRKTIGDGLYVLVEDQNTDLVPILAAKFWRSFVDLNDRLTVVTISSFRDKPLSNDEMLKYLVTQVKTLAVANRVPLNEPQTLIAAADTSSTREPTPVQSLTDIKPEVLMVTTKKQLDDVYSPVPRERPQVAEATTPEADPTTDADAIKAPTEADPSVAVEIAAASEAVPVPAPRKGTATETVEEDAQTNEVAAAPTQETTASQGVPLGDVAANTPSVASIQSVKVETSPDPAETVSVAGQVDVATPKPRTEAVEKTDAQETTAAVDTVAEPKPKAAATRNAPKSAPEAPRRPARS